MAFRISLLVVLAAIMAACAPAESGGGRAVEAYLNALIAKNPDAVINASCLDWEAGARADIDSFLTVDASLSSDFSCAVSGPNQVECTGAILFSYGDEIQELALAGTRYNVVEEAGEWRMCGYQ